MAETTQQHGGDNASRDKFRTVLTFDSREELGKFIRQYGFDVITIPRPDKERKFRPTFLLTQQEIERLSKERYRLEVFENASEISRERQKEVGRGDRFEGGRVAPKGLGRKIKEAK